MKNLTGGAARRARIACVAAAALIVLTACGGDDEAVAGSVAVDGSSTVFPLSDAAAELLAEENGDIEVEVGASGTGGGFELFCAGTTDISNASRAIEEDEIAACEAEGVEYVELRVATDALTVVANNDVPADCLTTEQLAMIWGEGSTISNWSEVDPSFGDQPLTLFGPGTDSGTFDYFTDVINGEEGVSRSDYEASEDDNVIAQGVSGTSGAMGYFGYSYYEENADSLKAIAVDSGAGCVAPGPDTASDGSYTPLARPLFVYVNTASYADNAAVKEYIDFYIEHLSELTTEAQFIGLNDEQKADLEAAQAELGG